MALGTLLTQPALAAPRLMSAPVAKLLARWAHAHQVLVAEIDPENADTGALVTAYGVPLSSCVNCVVVGGRRDGVERFGACAVLATTRADVNGLVKRTLDVRKASFLAMDRAVELTAMEYGGITPVGLPGDWHLLVDLAVLAEPVVVLGSGLRRSKLVMAGALVAQLPGAQVVDGLGLGHRQG